MNVELAKSSTYLCDWKSCSNSIHPLLITKIFDWMKGTKRLKPMVEKLEKKAMSKSDKIEKYEFGVLYFLLEFLFLRTGAWTGSLIAALLGIRFRKAFPAVVVGVCLSHLLCQSFPMELLAVFLDKINMQREVILMLLKR